MLSNDFSLFITPLKLGNRWILETGLLTHNLHFPEGKQKKVSSLPRGTHLCGFLSLIWQVIVLQYGRLRWHHHPTCNRPLLVLFNMCCWFWTRCMKYFAVQGTSLPSVAVREPSVRPEANQGSVPPPDYRNAGILLIWRNDKWCTHCILRLDWFLDG